MANRSMLKNPDAYREKERIRQRKYRAAQRKVLADAKSEKGCSTCGESHHACLQFHHTDPKTKLFAVNRGVVMKMRPEIIEAEVAKCKLLCANCHAKLHWEEQKEA